MALGIVKGKHDSARPADLVERAHERFRVERTTILVGAEMGVGVEDPVIGREPRKLGTERRVGVAAHKDAAITW
jgi:hypothetical protein